MGAAVDEQAERSCDAGVEPQACPSAARASRRRRSPPGAPKARHEAEPACSGPTVPRGATCASGATGNGREDDDERAPQLRGDSVGVDGSRACAGERRPSPRGRRRETPASSEVETERERAPQLDVVDRERRERLDEGMPRDHVDADRQVRARLAERLRRMDEAAWQVERIPGSQHDVEERLPARRPSARRRRGAASRAGSEAAPRTRARGRSSASRPRSGARRRRGCRSGPRSRATTAASRRR